MKITIWASTANESNEYGPDTTGYWTSREIAQKAAEREYRRSDDATEETYADSYDERKVKRSLGLPADEMVLVYDVTRLQWRPRFRGHNGPEDDLQLYVWKNTGAYGPDWHYAGVSVEKHVVQDEVPE